MKSLIIHIILTVCLTSSICAESEVVDIFKLYNSFPANESRFPIKLSWLIGEYDFDRIEEYIDVYYIDYYKSWERYLISKQREFASKFGLTDIIFKPDFRQYEKTKLVLSKSAWDDRLVFRYIAPMGDMTDFNVSIAFKPYRFVTFVGKGSLDGDGSALIVVSKPFGQDFVNKDSQQKASRLIKKIKQLAKHY